MNAVHSRIPVVGVMGGAKVNRAVERKAFELGAHIAEHGWILLNGGRDAGVMRASARGAKSRGGTTIGIVPGASKQEANPFIDIVIVTHLADARNLINVLSSDVVVACPGSAGTLSEIALAVKNNIPVVVLAIDENPCLRNCGLIPEPIYTQTVAECIAQVEHILSQSRTEHGG